MIYYACLIITPLILILLLRYFRRCRAVRADALIGASPAA